MAKTVILTVDDDPQVLSAIQRDLRGHYRERYRIMRASSGDEGLDLLNQLKQRGDAVALFLVDQRMPQMSGTEFLDSARKVYPQARKVLLTAYADTQAAIDSINSVGLDHYLMKPWDPPEQMLFPVLDDLLEDWEATVPVPYDGIRVAGTMISPPCHDVKDFLSRNQIPYQWLDIDFDSEARHMAETALQGQEALRLPVIFFPDGDILIQPNTVALADKVGLQTTATRPFYDLAVIGAGPAGLAAAVYGASEGLSTIVFEKEAPGGQAGTSSRIENYLGFPSGLTGADLARRASAQAQRFGAEILTPSQVVEVRVEDNYRFLTLADGTEISCKALVVATGVAVRELEKPGVRELAGAGVYYGAALTEAAFYRDREMYVVGGANSAGQGAMFFSRYASKVTMLIRGESLTKSMSQYLIDQIEGTPNIEVLSHTEVVEARGEDRLEALHLINNQTNEDWVCPADAMFIFIGAAPFTDLVAHLVERDDHGYLLTGPDLIRDGKRPRGWRLPRDPFLLETSMPGIFAAGDVRSGSMKRVASAVGEGAATVSMVHRYLEMV